MPHGIRVAVFAMGMLIYYSLHLCALGLLHELYVPCVPASLWRLAVLAIYYKADSPPYISGVRCKCSFTPPYHISCVDAVFLTIGNLYAMK